ncbi:OmpA family protein [Streptomyces sp. KMM 9044]|uniref:OmpA family protein n=1 Tax=Streptomyces sp. KMM 9044 TaxID=2744474 RepID=UPI0021507CB6|nr:OmpA family protein [Streptomyces sp. KMM 9044]WAX79519.1 OmpA family protein [Streptomyces sp. KMM 9044]
MTQTRSSRLIAAACALTAVVAGSGCSAFDTPEAQPCAWLDRGSDGADNTGRQTIVLVDRSPSARPDRTTRLGGRVPDWTTTLLAARELAPAAWEGGTLSAAGFDGTRATVSWEVDRAFVAPVKGNDTLKKDRRSGRRGCLEQRLRQLAAEAPSTGRTDVLGALAAADDQLGSQGGRRRIVVATDGLTNTGCADLRSAGFDGTAEIKATVERCREAGELPDLTGTEVNLVGIGHAARGKAPSSPQTAWLITFWTSLCDATGASSCDVTATARVRPAGKNTLAGKLEPEVTFPAVAEQQSGRNTTIILPGSVLFASDRAELSRSAQSALDDAARRITDLHPVSVAVSGHTDSRGSEQRGRQLSLARAQAVRAALAERGITVASAHGYSDDRPSCTPEYHDGIPDYAAMACNRRVEIAVTVRG